MDNKIQYIGLVFFLCILAAACNVTKSLPEGEALYTGATVKLKGDELSARQRKAVRSNLQSMTRPRPNSRFLGIPFKLYIYNMLRNKKENSFFGKLRSKWGEPPVLMSSVDLEQNVKVLESHLENKGFFNAAVAGDTTVKNRKGSAQYVARTGNQYRIDSIAYEQDTSELSRTIRASAANSLLKPGDPFDLDAVIAERTRIDAYLKERGFYYFSPDYLLVLVDSTNGQHQVDLKVTVKPETPVAARKIYRIDDVYIYSNYSLSTADIDTNRTHAQFYQGYYVVDKERKYKPSLFEQAMQFNPGDVYNRTDHNQTLNRLINLNLFKFVKNRFEPSEAENDSARLDAFYYLTPLPKKSIRAQIGTSTKSNNLGGTQLSFNFHNRNTFRAGEHLNVNVYGGSEAQFSGTFKGYPVFRAGTEINFTFPRFVIPWFDVRTRGGYMPRTNIQLGYELVNRRRLYSMNSFRGAYGYLWKENIQKQHEFYPISITYAQPVNATQEYRNALLTDKNLQHIIDTQFIMGSTYQYNLNQLATGVQPLNAFYFNGLVDVAGNLAGLFVSKAPEGEKRLFGSPFSQYIKLETDGRYYRRIGLKSTWANRIILGYGLPYGNSEQLPFIKQFFVGGNNSIRAFRSRSVGPGTYLPPQVQNFIPDQTGDIKLEINTEYRPHISGPIYGALFVDAGNVWLKNENPNKPGAAFSKDFLKELAVGAGVGIRFDITMFVIRLDVAIPLRKPWEQNPWVMNQINFRNREWRQENIVYNLAIGYPF